MLVFNRPVTTPLLLGQPAAGSPAVSSALDPTSGFSFGSAVIEPCISGAKVGYILATGACFPRLVINYANQDVILERDAAAVLALKNGTNAQEFRVYGTTTGPKYLSMLHDGTDGYVNAQSGLLKLGGTAVRLANAIALKARNAANTADMQIAVVNGSDSLLIGSNAGAGIFLQPDSDGKIGFFGTTPVVKPTGVAVTAAGVHAALVTLGLIAA